MKSTSTLIRVLSAHPTRVPGVTIALLALVFAPFLASASDSFAAVWDRYPELAAPRLAEAPEIDGHIEPAEWSGALLVTPLIKVQDGFLDESRTQVWLAYTEEELLLAWRFHRDTDTPYNIDTPTPGRHAGRRVWRDDVAEIFFEIPDGPGGVVTFVGNPAGAFGDGLLTVNTDFDREWSWSYGARETDAGWEGELALPFSELGLDAPPEPGAAWKMDFWRHEKPPFGVRASLAMSGRDPQRMARLNFVGQGPAWRINEIGPIDDETLGVRAEIENTTDSEAAIEVDYGIYRRSDDISRFNFFEEVDAVLDEPADEVAAFTTPEQEVQNLLESFETYDEQTLTFTLGAGESRPLDLTVSPSPAGDYVIAYRAAVSDGPVLASGLTPAVRWDPLHVEAVPFYLTADKLEVSASVHTQTLRERTERMRMRLWQDGEEVVVTEVDAERFDERIGLSTQQIASGDYRLEVEALDESGEVRERVERQRHRPEPPFWAQEDHGKSQFVPEPWTAVEADTTAARVWGRQYQMAGGFLPQQIEVHGEPLFSRAPRVHLVVDGEPVSLTGETELVGSDQEHAEYRWTGQAGGMPVSATARLEFDGFLTVDLELEPGEREIEAFHVEFPLDARWAELFHRYWFPPHVPTDNAPARSGYIGDGFACAFNIAMWLGNPDAGLQWTAESDQHWYPDPDHPERSIEVIPGDDETLLRLRVVDRPVQPEQTLSYRWGLQATPDRPFRSEHRDTFVVQQPGLNRELHEDADVQERFANRLEGMKRVGGTHLIVHSGWRHHATDGFGQPYTWDDDTHASAQHAAQMARERDLKTVFYAGWNSLPPAVTKWWPDYGEEMRAMIKGSPLRFSIGGYRQCARSTYEDYFANGAAWMARELGVDGLFLDGTAQPFFCDEPNHGCGYHHPETGERRPTANIWSTREMFKRFYKIFHGEMVEDGLIYSHAGANLRAISTFTDVAHTGEGASLDTVMNLDQYRASHYAMLTGHRVEHARGGGDTPLMVERGVALVHGNDIKMYPTGLRAHQHWQRDTYADERGIAWRMWWPQQWFDWSEAQWHPYYRNDAVLDVRPESVKASFYVNPAGQILLYAFNLDDEPARVQTRFDLATLGLPSRLHARDAVTNETWEVDDGELSFDIYGLRPRVIVLAPEPIEEPVVDSTGWWSR